MNCRTVSRIELEENGEVVCAGVEKGQAMTRRFNSSSSKGWARARVLTPKHCLAPNLRHWRDVRGRTPIGTGSPVPRYCVWQRWQSHVEDVSQLLAKTNTSLFIPVRLRTGHSRGETTSAAFWIMCKFCKQKDRLVNPWIQHQRSEAMKKVTQNS